MFLGCRCCGGKCRIGYTNTIISNRLIDVEFDRIDHFSAIDRYKVVLDFFGNQCPRLDGYDYLDPALIKDYVENGGIYITHCEWTNGLGPDDQAIESRCDPYGEPFNNHMSAIGSSIRRELGTVTTDRVYTKYDHQIFENCIVSGDASSGLVGGIALLSGNSGSAWSRCTANMRSLLTRGIEYTVCSAEIIGDGLVVAFGDSNISIQGQFWNNLCKYTPEDLLQISTDQNPLP